MKLCLIGSGIVPMPPKKGGAVELIEYEIARHMASNHEVHVIDISSDRKEHAIKFHNIPMKIPRNVILQRNAEYCFGKKAMKIASTLNPDIIHAHTVFTALPFTGMKSSGKRVYTSHNPAWTVPEKELDKANMLIKKIERCVLRKFDRVTAVSDSMKNGMINAGIPGEKITVIKNFVDMKRFSPKHGKKWKHTSNINGKIVLFVGKMTENKGVRYLIESIYMVTREIPEAKFIFVGPTSFETSALDKKWLEAVKRLGVEKYVIFTGAVPDDELPGTYSSADVFCLPTLREGLPVVVLEALASGLPVVSTSISGVPEAVNSKNGVLVERRSPDQLAQAIIKMLKNPPKKSGIVRSVKSFEIKKIMNEYCKFYEGLA